MSAVTTLDQVQTLLGRSGKKSHCQPIIKNLHDDLLSSFSKISSEKLIVHNLNNQQIWQQMNNHLNEALPQWSRFMERVDKRIQREEEEQHQEEQEDGQAEEQYDNGQEIDQEEEEGKFEEEEEPMEQEEEEQVDEKMLEMEDEEDVGLYGEQLDEEDDEEEDEGGNPLDDDEDQQNMMRDEQEIEDDNLEDENFEHFREVEMGNDGQGDQEDGRPKQQQQQPEDQISRQQHRLLSKKDWRVKGQVAAKDRPVDSLIDTTLQFKRNIKPTADIDEQYNSQIENIIKQRVLDQLYDDRARYQFAPGFREHFTALPEISTEKNKQSLGQLYEEDFKNSLGLKESKDQKLKSQIMQIFKELNYKLDCLTNFNFMPKPVIKEATITHEPYILKEEKIPITVAKDRQDAPENLRKELKSEKELDHRDRQGARLKNKRIARQRKKEHDAKKANRSIEYGGQTKFQAEARKKILKNKQSGTKIKYSQSGQFFKALQENTASKSKSKPNPNINKIKM